MGLGIRVFLIDGDNRLRRISLKRFHGLIDRRDDVKPLPEYAGQRVRYALTILEVENRKPIAIKGIDCYILKFDDTGLVDKDDWNKQKCFAVSMLDSFFPERVQGPVIDARKRFLQKQYEHEYRWQPSSEVEKAIIKEIFGKKEPPLKLV
ncbi:MAG TPA: hypothetical protein VNO70_11390 [Blastocatellia bacterium]|nr:hypothetical protein [Blastocatellia bacterium]